MKALSRAAAAAVVAVALASPCWAGQVKLEIRDGLVTLSAKDASVREILAEWARVGQVRIVNAERVSGGLVTLELIRVPEARALDVLLRSVAGYLAAPRAVATGAASRFDRIMVMAQPRPAGGASASAPAPPPATAPMFEPRNRMGYQPQPSLMVDDQDEPVQPQPQPQQMMPAAPMGAAQPGMATPIPGGMPNPGQPGAATPGQATRPGVMTAPPKLPGGPGGQ